MKKISVIVPVFNCIQWLEPCIESVLKQTFKEFELILVDDGSTDGSGELCDFYATRDKRIRVFHKPNGSGGGEARNYGIEKSKGEFIVFLDSDDCQKPSMLEELYQAQQKADYDLVICGYCFLDENNLEGDKFALNATEIKGEQNVLDYFVNYYPDGLVGYPWNKLYRRSIIEENHIRFPKMRRLEDGIFNVAYFQKIKSASVLDKVLMLYRVNCQVALRKLPYDFYENMKLFTKDYYGFLKKLGTTRENMDKPFVIYFLNDFVCCLENILANSWEGKSYKDRRTYVLQLQREKLVQYMLGKIKYAPTYSRLVLKLFQMRFIGLLKAVICMKLWMKKNANHFFAFLKKFN